MNPENKIAWHFIRSDGKLRDGQEAVLGNTYRVDPPLVMCEHGLHFSYRALDALQYSGSAIVTLVKVGGTVVMGDDKGCCTERTIIAGPVDATDTLREFARWCALQVIHLWDCPTVVKEYLETGKEELRAAAWSAAWSAAWATAWATTREAARSAAWAAAWSATRATSRDATREAAWAASESEACDEEYQKYNDHLEAMLLALLKYDVTEVTR